MIQLRLWPYAILFLFRLDSHVQSSGERNFVKRLNKKNKNISDVSKWRVANLKMLFMQVSNKVEQLKNYVYFCICVTGYNVAGVGLKITVNSKNNNKRMMQTYHIVGLLVTYLKYTLYAMCCQTQ